MTELAAESRAAGLAPTPLADLICGAHVAADGLIVAPNLAQLIHDIGDDAAEMIHAVNAGNKTEGDAASARLAMIRNAGLLEATGDIEIARIARLTGVSEEGPDSLHRLVMDLHKALNRLAAGCAEETVAGAHAFGLRPEDRATVESFMRGVNDTRALKFNHPGLDTMATRSGGRLLIQNDIGTTDAHVLVVAVDEHGVTVTHSDVHLARAKFFIALLQKFQMQWSALDRHTASGLGEENAFFLVTGRFQSESAEQRNAFLTSLGASLVFLIDWNKARKLLRNWVSKNDAVHILEWAARHKVGHRGFLELGGDELLGSAVRNVAATRIGFGERLDQALGRTATIELLKSALRNSTEALKSGQSVRLVRDQIEADLARHLERVDSTLLAIVLRQIGLAHDIAIEISRHVEAIRSGRPTDGKGLTARAGRIEQKADHIAIEARKEISRLNAKSVIEQLVDRAEEAVDELEQAAFIASLLRVPIDATLASALAGLCGIATRATEAAASGLAAAVEVPERRRVDSEDALGAVVKLIDAEHAADTAERAITALVLTDGFEVAISLSVLELARAVERATDRLAGFGHLLRRHIMADLSA